MAIENFIIPPLKPGELKNAKNFNVIPNDDPQKVLGEFGFSVNEIDDMMRGDYTAARNYRKKLQQLDFDKMMDIHMKTLSKEICSMFFERSKVNQPFSDEEIEAYSDTYNKMFEKMFEIGDDHVFLYDEIDSKNLLVSFSGETYQLSIVAGQAVILFIGQI
jgi:hypothetical protein